MNQHIARKLRSILVPILFYRNTQKCLLRSYQSICSVMMALLQLQLFIGNCIIDVIFNIMFRQGIVFLVSNLQRLLCISLLFNISYKYISIISHIKHSTYYIVLCSLRKPILYGNVWLSRQVFLLNSKQSSTCFSNTVYSFLCLSCQSPEDKLILFIDKYSFFRLCIICF